MLVDRLASEDLYMCKVSTVCTKGFDLGLWAIAFTLPLLIGKQVIVIMLETLLEVTVQSDSTHWSLRSSFDGSFRCVI